MSNKADLVLKNGNFYSVNIEGQLERFQAVAIKNGVFTYVGSNEGVGKHIDSNTLTVDLEGKMVLPGLSDSHVHASFSAISRFSANLYNLAYTEPQARPGLLNKYKDIMRANLQNNPDQEIIRGAGFDGSPFFMDAGGFPDRHDLDEVCRDKPVVLRSSCLHYAWANTKALELAGITRDTADPGKGIICRDGEGNPTGFFQEMPAIDRLLKYLPGYDFSVEQYKDALRYYQKNLANSYGITLIYDALATDNALRAYLEMAEHGELTIRVRGCYYADPEKDLSQFDQLVKPATDYSVSKRFAINTVKFFMDGTGMSICMTEPYEQIALDFYQLPSDYRGDVIWPPELFKEALVHLTQKGFQVHVHTMGDGAVAQTLDAFEYLAGQVEGKSLRNVIAHVMAITEQDKQRMADLGVIAAMQPSWMYVNSLYTNGYALGFGEKRADRFYPTKSLLEAGVRVTAGTDYPITIPPNPFHSIQVGMTRKISKSNPEYENYKDALLGPAENREQECLSLKEIVESLTISTAYQNYLETVTGSIEKGKSADLVILSQDLETAEVMDIENTRVEMLYLEGKLIFRDGHTDPDQQ